MIGSHDTYTFKKAKNWAVNLMSKFWRCQDKTIQEQYDAGVRFFDIRVFRNKNKWQAAHGLAEFDVYFTTIEDICKQFESNGVKYRIWLEKGSDADWELFKQECAFIKDEYPGFVEAYRKFKEPFFTKETHPKMKYYACEMEKFSNIISGLWTRPIKSWAKKNNPTITQEMIDDPNVIYFMDYVGR